MWEYRPVVITEGSFAFCRYTIAILLWLGLVLQNIWFIVLVTIIMLLSAILRVRNAPLVWLYRKIVEPIKPSPEVVVDEKGIFFAHSVAVMMGGLSILFFLIAHPIFTWCFVGIFAILKTMAAFGKCSALKLYGCMSNGTCCRFGKKLKEHTK